MPELNPGRTFEIPRSGRLNVSREFFEVLEFSSLPCFLLCPLRPCGNAVYCPPNRTFPPSEGFSEITLRFCALASGSKGNCIYVESNGTRILVDAGLSRAQIVRRLSEIGVRPETLSAVVITHEHTDHVRGAPVLSRTYHVPVYVNEGTRRSWDLFKRTYRNCAFETGTPFAVGGLRLEPFSVPHDAADPVGLVISNGEKRIGIASDLGIATGLVRERLRGTDALIVESNHDPVMLEEGPYPWELKQRISGTQGHLSNDDCGMLVQELLHGGLRHVVLAHLSEVNNQPDVARRCVQAYLEDAGALDLNLSVACQDLVGPLFEL